MARHHPERLDMHHEPAGSLSPSSTGRSSNPGSRSRWPRRRRTARRSRGVAPAVHARGYYALDETLVRPRTRPDTDHSDTLGDHTSRQQHEPRLRGASCSRRCSRAARTAAKAVRLAGHEHLERGLLDSRAEPRPAPLGLRAPLACRRDQFRVSARRAPLRQDQPGELRTVRGEVDVTESGGAAPSMPLSRRRRVPPASPARSRSHV